MSNMYITNNSKTEIMSKFYISNNGKTENGSKIYLVQDGKTALLWGGGFNNLGIYAGGRKSEGFYSTDIGQTWERSKPMGPNIEILDVVYGNGMFLATILDPSKNNNLAYSKDGINWFLTFAYKKDYLIAHVIFAKNKFVISAGDYLYYSYEAINWIKVPYYDKFPYPADDIIYEAICYNADYDVVAGVVKFNEPNAPTTDTFIIKLDMKNIENGVQDVDGFNYNLRCSGMIWDGNKYFMVMNGITGAKDDKRFFTFNPYSSSEKWREIVNTVKIDGDVNTIVNVYPYLYVVGSNSLLLRVSPTLGYKIEDFSQGFYPEYGQIISFLDAENIKGILYVLYDIFPRNSRIMCKYDRYKQKWETVKTFSPTEITNICYGNL